MKTARPYNAFLARAADGAVYSAFPRGDVAFYPYNVYPKLAGGIFDNDTIPNTSAKWRVVSADSPERWEWFNGGGYIFDAAGAAAGTYVAVYEVRNWDGEGSNATASVTVAVT